ncbi:U3 small nucleolar RNA-associated protein 6 [Ceratobasidium sp. AG-Ba]|nr:U3 small nucleolar RNA-associated protein 6 [Ceratobasidium sp. AG-Ba]
MERVHYHQEQMLPELKEFEEKGIFSQLETRAILKQRTVYETALIRRVALKSDYIKYLNYEITLEALRKKRVERLSAVESKTSLSDYSIVRRQFYILERAVRKFKNDVSLWIHYIELAKSNNARGLVGKLCSRALSLHPTSPSLYVIAASHELETTLSPAGARALLQRGLRINSESVILWTEYIRMELGYCEGLRRRWKTLGVDAASPDENAEAREEILSGKIVQAVITSAIQSAPTLELLGSIQKLLRSYPTELRGDLVNYMHSQFASHQLNSGPATDDLSCGAVLLRATAGLPSRHLGQNSQLPRIPSLPPLIAAAFPVEAQAFSPDEETPEFVQQIQKANETLSTCGKENVRVAELYARWVAAWVEVITEKSLSLYLVLALTQTANQLCKSRVEQLDLKSLSTVLRITLHLNKAISPDETQHRKLAKKFTKACGGDPALWIARLDVESGANRPLDTELSTYSPAYDLPQPIENIWAEAREKAEERTGEEDLLADLWTWGIRHVSRDLNSPIKAKLWATILRQSLSHSSLRLHSLLLHRHLYDDLQTPTARAVLAKTLVARYRPSTLFFETAMDQETAILASDLAQFSEQAAERPRKKRRRDQSKQATLPAARTKVDTSCLEALYTAWRVIPDQQTPAALKWATSLRRLNEEERADEVIAGAGGLKGSLKQEWEKARERVSRCGEGETDAITQAEGDIDLRQVEFR